MVQMSLIPLHHHKDPFWGSDLSSPVATPANKGLTNQSVGGCHYSPRGPPGREMQMPFQHQQCLGHAGLSRAGSMHTGHVLHFKARLSGKLEQIRKGG